MEIVNHFGPAMVKFKADHHIIDVLNHYADHVLANEGLLKGLDYTESLSRAVHGSFKIKVGFLKEVEKYLLQSATEYLEKFAPHLKDDHTFDIQSMWFVSQREGSWSYLHDHVCDLAGIIYLKVPKDPAYGLSPEDPRSNFPGGISFTQGTPGTFHNATAIIKPNVGAFYLFPASLLHTVYPFFGPEERRSFSFNMKLVKKQDKT
jgi:hypothetical protein